MTVVLKNFVELLRAVINHTGNTNINYIMSNENGYKLIENTKFKLGGEHQAYIYMNINPRHRKKLLKRVRLKTKLLL